MVLVVYFGYMNGYGFYADLISECVCLSSSSDTRTPYPILPYILLFSLCNFPSHLSLYHMTYYYNFYPMTMQLPG